MSYVDDNLSKNEKVLFRASVSKAVFLGPILMALLTIGVFAISVGRNSVFASEPIGQSFMILFSLILGFFVFFLVLQALIYLATTEFAVTNRRVIAKRGFIRRRTVEMLLMKVESVSVYQSVVGRIFNYGTVIVTGTGGTKEGFSLISDPLEVRKKVNEILEAYMHAYSSYQQSKAAETQFPAD
ncbi:MAG: PH domain-containing protein [Anaerolineae bacterium]|nr:PH domain-containing protein [Anaerolineae bacterium]